MEKRHIFSILLVILFVAETSQTVSHIIDPAYYYSTSPYWDRLAASAPQVSIAIGNVNNGPGNSVDQNFTIAFNKATSNGIALYGYVPTNYGKRAIADVQNDVDLWVNFYQVEGIFFDEASDNCTFLSYYETIYVYAKNQTTGKVIINPGTQVPECFVNASDIIVNYEGKYADYLNNWQNSNWIYKYSSSRFFHIVYGVKSESQIAKLYGLSNGRNAGYAYYTSDALPNPYDTLPPSCFWLTELDTI